MSRTTTLRQLPAAAITLLVALALAAATLLLAGPALVGDDNAGATWHKSTQAGATWHSPQRGATWH